MYIYKTTSASLDKENALAISLHSESPWFFIFIVLLSVFSLSLGSNSIKPSLANSSCCTEEREMAAHSSVLAWRIPGMGEPGGLLSIGSHRVGYGWSDLATVLHRRVHKCTAARRGCIQENILQTHEQAYMTGQVNACLHLWQLSTWRFICRGLTVYTLIFQCLGL